MQKRFVHKLPHTVKVIENEWIPLSDGTRLSCRLWLPSDNIPRPAILEYIPYRKRDGTRTRDEPMHGYFAGHGYACVRVDMRGSGESDGLLQDEYLLQEQDDAIEVIEWIKSQVWCNGRVGMMGKSWGGFNSLQVAVRRPVGLDAIITVCFADNRFTSDIHWKGGCLLNDNFWWGSIMLAYQSRPVDPFIVGECWKDMWLHRLENMPLNIADWTEHQTYDKYWMHGSVCENYDSINIPVMAVSGWADSYTNCVFTLLSHINCPVKGIVGPWAHIYPQDGIPQPAIGFLQESLNWWDKWLKNKTNDDDDGKSEKSLQVWIEHYMPPNVHHPVSEGHWVSLPPSIHSQCKVQTMLIDHGRLLDTNDDTVNRESRYVLLKTPLNHGLLSGEWMGAGVSGESPADQRIDDGLAMVFDGPVLKQDVEILGSPTFTVKLTCDKSKAMLFAQLSDVAPNGEVRRISFGTKNLVLSMDNKEIIYLEEGKEVLTSVKLDYCGYRFPKDHRIQLSLANSFFGQCSGFLLRSIH